MSYTVFGCMFRSDMVKLSHLLPAVNQLEILCRPQPFSFNLRVCVLPDLCINYVELRPEWALPLMQTWLCAQFSLIHTPSLGDLVVLCPTQTVSHTQKCQGANSCCCAAACYGCIINAKIEKLHLSHIQAHRPNTAFTFHSVKSDKMTWFGLHWWK